MVTELQALTLDELDKSCTDNGLTSLICEQGFYATLEDVLNDNPDLDRNSDKAKVATMERMLEENLNFGALSEDKDTDEDHSDRLESRWDIIETIAVAWVFGRCAALGCGRENTLKDAQDMCDYLVQKQIG